jgi:NADP-dependent 3-hydroxy acid dehydrogenase YdfG
VRIGPGTRAIVSGASRGIGEATARALAARGARVGLMARGEERLRSLAGEIGGDAIMLPADVGERGEVEKAIANFVEEAGGLELLIANAGIAHYAPFTDLTIERAEEMVQTNLLGTIYLVRAALPHMLDRAAGHVVVVSSGAALRAFPWAGVYGATKAAQKSFAEALRHELSGTGVSLTTVFPGEVATDLHTHQLERLPDWRHTDEAIPAGRVADAIVGAVEADRREVHVPGVVRLLGLNDLAPRILDRLLAAVRGRGAAPRRD